MNGMSGTLGTKVSKDDVVSVINQTAGAVKISANCIDLEGYVPALLTVSIGIRPSSARICENVPSTASIVKPLISLYIGGWESGWGMVSGTIMDIRIYNKCIDADAVSELNDIFSAS